MAVDILVVDDERDIRELVSGVLSDEGYECRVAGDSGSALRMVDERRPSLVLLDVWLHGSPMDGLEVLDAIKAREPELPVIIFSGHGNIDTAVSAVSRGAMDFIEKPFETERLLLLVERATETERLRRENTRLKQDNGGGGEEFTGNSAAVNQVRATLKRVANTGSRVLI
ncbi:MAG: sigma-54-dependent Fis family transcriptional regulator, partial [Citromicrobium sp.]|nr:sigma-54-dependent Fis family transcriptional regulator [Citromicrobium sp.]